MQHLGVAGHVYPVFAAVFLDIAHDAAAERDVRAQDAHLDERALLAVQVETLHGPCAHVDRVEGEFDLRLLRPHARRGGNGEDYDEEKFFHEGVWSGFILQR